MLLSSFGVKADTIYCPNFERTCLYSTAIQDALAPRQGYYALTTDGYLVPAQFNFDNPVLFYVVVYSVLFILVMLSIFTLYL